MIEKNVFLISHKNEPQKILTASFIYNSSTPTCFNGKTMFPGQFQVTLTQAKFTTPNKITSCKFKEGFAIYFDQISENYEDKIFRGCVNGTILSIHSPEFKEYYHVTEHGIPIETLEDLYKRLIA